MTPDRGVEQGHRGGVVQGWALVEALVRAMVIETAHVLVEDGAGGRGTSGCPNSDRRTDPILVPENPLNRCQIALQPTPPPGHLPRSGTAPGTAGGLSPRTGK